MPLNRSVPDIQEKRKEWNDIISTVGIEHIVFLDESGVNINSTRLYGRAKSNQRVVDSIPLTRPKNTTVLASIRLNGEIRYTTFSGGTTKEKFQAYLQDVLLPSLSEDDIIIMDNMKTHRAHTIKNFLFAMKALFDYLPAYSPDFNPIEKMWSKMKACLQKMKPRTIDALLADIEEAISQITRDNCIGWFKSCGYVMQ